MIYLCCNERRRNAVEAHPTLNGIDYLEVVDRDSPVGTPRQLTLLLRLFKTTPTLTQDNIVIDGGERITPVGIVWVTPASAPDTSLFTPHEPNLEAFLTVLPDADRTLVIRTDSSGDYSTYTLRLIGAASSMIPPADFDPLLSRVDFSFKVECPSDFDCHTVSVCPDEPAPPPVINYLAKDYGSFRRLMLDRMAQIMPDWRDRNPADLGIALVELLAYVGDHLSYQQDAVGTEAYLATARRRASVRRHARLVDYAMHDGSNARTWIHIRVDQQQVSFSFAPTDPPMQFLTRVTGEDAVLSPSAPPSELNRIFRQDPVVFEIIDAIGLSDDPTPTDEEDLVFSLFQDNNDLFFYTWEDRECCLPTGATRATLRGHRTRLKAGQVIVIEEVLGPKTGRPEDADPMKRHAVRLVEVVSNAVDPVNDKQITEIRWHADDALPFPICISSRTDEDHGGGIIDDVSKAVGNIVLADHGTSILAEAVGAMPVPHLFVVPETSGDRCEAQDRQAIPPRFRPTLRERPLTQAAPYTRSAPPSSAHAALSWSTALVLPQVTLHGSFKGQTDRWLPQRDLLASDGDKRHFVAESETDTRIEIRFGDDYHGMRPQSETVFAADYRVGNGRAGNVGADSIAHVFSDLAGIVSVRNPLPAQGGIEPETMEEARRNAPVAFRTQERAVTPEDYGAVSERHPEIQRAAATFRWTGSWHTVFVTVDRIGGAPVTDAFEQDLRQHLEPFRMAGYDLEVDAPRFVSLEIDLFVCAKPDYFRSEVKAALLQVLSTRRMPDGRRGLFHPDNFTFAQTVYLSTVYAAAQSVQGVASVEVTKFQKQGVPDPTPLEDGRIDLGRLEIARLDNDPDFPEHGVLRINMAGGK